MGNNIPLKYIWGSRVLEDELRRISDIVQKERGLNLRTSTLSHQLALDIKEGRIIFEPEILRFRNTNVVKVGDFNLKLKKI